MAKGAAVGVVVGMSVIVILVGTGVGNDDGSKDGGSDGWREGAVVFSCAIVVVVLLITTRRHNATTSRLVFHIMVFLQEKVQTLTVSFLEIQAHTRRSRRQRSRALKRQQQKPKQQSNAYPISLCNSSRRLSKQYDKRCSSSLSLQPGIDIKSWRFLLFHNRRKIARRDCGGSTTWVPWKKPRKWQNKMIRHTQDSLYGANMRRASAPTRAWQRPTLRLTHVL